MKINLLYIFLGLAFILPVASYGVTIPSSGLIYESSSYGDDDDDYSGGISTLSIDQQGDPWSSSDPWEGTWSDYLGGTSTAETAMGMSPSAFFFAEWGSDAYISSFTFSKVLDKVMTPCTTNGGTYYDCYNYAVDVYNIGLSNINKPLGWSGNYESYIFPSPLSTEPLLFAALILGYGSWVFAGSRRKNRQAKA